VTGIKLARNGRQSPRLHARGQQPVQACSRRSARLQASCRPASFLMRQGVPEHALLFGARQVFAFRARGELINDYRSEPVPDNRFGTAYHLIDDAGDAH
jgi:hypothetical protein